MSRLIAMPSGFRLHRLDAFEDHTVLISSVISLIHAQQISMAAFFLVILFYLTLEDITFIFIYLLPLKRGI